MRAYDLHIIMDNNVDFSTMSPALQNQLLALSSEWPSFPALNTKEYIGKKVVHARVQALEMNETILQAMYDKHNLNWQTIGIREAFPQDVVIGNNEFGAIIKQQYAVIKPISKSVILPFLSDAQDVDSNGNVITRRPTLTDTVYLPMYSGTDPIRL